MQSYIISLKEYLAAAVLNYGDEAIETMLEFLWTAYTQENPVYNETIRGLFASMEPILGKLSFSDSDDLFRIICSVCVEHERMAFLSGLHVGAKLMQELP